MKKIQYKYTETNYGTAEITVPDDATPEQIDQAAEEAYYAGSVFWNNSDLNYETIK